MVRIGVPVPLTAQHGVALRLTARGPSLSRTRLSSSHGYPPSHGYYVTFRLVVVNTGSQPVQLSPGNFVVRVAGQGSVTPFDGNAPYSGAPAQLTTTVLSPGETLRSPVTFDVRRPTGRLSYVPDRSPAVTWIY